MPKPGMGNSPSKKSPTSRVALARKKPEHWHQFSDGRIERGKRKIGDDGVCIHKLGGEHIAVGRKITFELPAEEEGKEPEEDEGLVTAWGDKGVKVMDAEGQSLNVYWKEITAIEPEKKPKKRSKPKVPKQEVKKSILRRIFPWLD